MFKQRVVFVHGAGNFGAAAWPRQHGMALSYDALFLRRHGYDAVAEPVESSFAEDTAIIEEEKFRPIYPASANLSSDNIGKIVEANLDEALERAVQPVVAIRSAGHFPEPRDELRRHEPLLAELIAELDQILLAAAVALIGELREDRQGLVPARELLVEDLRAPPGHAARPSPIRSRARTPSRATRRAIGRRTAPAIPRSRATPPR